MKVDVPLVEEEAVVNEDAEMSGVGEESMLADVTMSEAAA